MEASLKRKCHFVMVCGQSSLIVIETIVSLWSLLWKGRKCHVYTPWELVHLCMKQKHIKAGTKWLPFCRQHFQMNFLQWKSLHFDSNFSEMCSWVSIYNRPISQILECICAISHNAPFCNRNVHISVTKWYIVGYGTDAFWDLWDGSISHNWLR